jgi:hypothetical protein
MYIADRAILASLFHPGRERAHDMKNSAVCHGFAALLCGAIALPAGPARGAKAIEISKDTVWENGFFSAGFADSAYIENTTSDTVIIDSIYADPVTNAIVFEARFNMMQFFNQDMQNNAYNRGIYYPKIKIAPDNRSLLADFLIDICIACPLTKQKATNKLEDTMTVRFEFVNKKNEERDTLVLIGKRQVVHTYEYVPKTTFASHTAICDKKANPKGQIIPPKNGMKHVGEIVFPFIRP